jgi:hypothetical protein
MLTAIYRMAYVQRHGLDEEDIAYTREVLVPYLDAEDMFTAIECLFGDAAGRTLGSHRAA